MVLYGRMKSAIICNIITLSDHFTIYLYSFWHMVAFQKPYF